MDEKRPPSESSEDTESGEGSERRRTIYRRKKSRCDGRLWIFLVLGALILVLGIVIGGLYFNIRTLTESTEFTEVTPTYVSAIAVLCSALSVALLFWRRLTCLVFLCVITCTVTAFLCGITAILTGTHVVRPITHFTQCFYFMSMRECHCNSPYKRSMLELEYSPHDPVNVVFRDADSCESIETVLLHMLFALIGTYVLSFFLTVAAAVLSLLVLRMEKIRMGMFEDDTYEEIFTVSNSSATPPTSDSDTEHQQMLHPVLPSTDDGRVPESHIIHRSRSFSQPRFPTSNDTPVEKNVPKITVSPACPAEQQGKLKEHRRRNRRAVTLHNLDTHQLMVILSLQMRYLQENENAKSQTTLNAQQLSQQLRRALTPQPNHDRHNQAQGSDIRQVRSHTPQPYHFKNRTSYTDQTAPNYENMFDPTEFIRQMKQEQALTARNANTVPAERELCPQSTVPTQRPKTPRQGYTAQTIPPPQTSRKGNKTPVRLNYYEEIDDVADCLDDSSASDQIYENQTERLQAMPRRKRGQGEGQVVPDHVTCDGISAQRDITNILPALYPSIPRHLFDRSRTPTRPKSYLNAVDPSDSPQVSRRDQSHNARQHNQPLQQAPSRVNPPNQGSTQTANSGSQSTDIYAMPARSQHPPVKPARNHNLDWQAQQQLSLPGQSEGRSAFHAVPRSKKKTKPNQQWNVPSDPAVARLQVSARSLDGHVGEFNMQGQSNHVSNVSAFFPPPPYSPPPSYTDVMTHSRDSSLHSLTSSTSTSDDVDFYQQIRKPQPPAQASSQNIQNHGSQNSVLSQLWGNSSVRPESIPYTGPPSTQAAAHPSTCHPSSCQWNGQSYQNTNQIQSGPVRNHSVQKTNRRKEYENFDEPVRGPRQSDRVAVRRNIPGSEVSACYGGMSEGNSSDSDCMETVI